MRILCIGLITIDVFQQVPRLPGSDEKLRVAATRVIPGGPATNAAVGARVTPCFSRCEVDLLTRCGTGPFRPVVDADMHARGVGLIDADPDWDISVATIIVDSSTGRRSILAGGDGNDAARVGNGTLAPDVDVSELVDVSHYDAVLIDGYHADLALPVVAAAWSCGIPVVLDAGSYKPYLDQLMPYVTIAAVSDSFQVPSESDPESDPEKRRLAWAAKYGVESFMVTRGPDPIYAVYHPGGDDETVVEVPVTPVSSDAVVDTCGAGDFFHGGLVVAAATHRSTVVPRRAESGSEADALNAADVRRLIYALVRPASQVAAASITSLGTREWIETMVLALR